MKETVTAVAAQERATQLPGEEGEGRRHCFVTYLDVRGKSKDYSDLSHHSSSLLVQLVLLELTATREKGEEE